MSQKIEFGTDGIRGPVGQFPMDESSIRTVGIAIANYLDCNGSVAIAMDTRESGPSIANILIQTLTEHGIHVVSCGILPTAALACVVVEDNLDLGVVVTASHNPWTDNGVKLFNAKGGKLSPTEQQTFEDKFYNVPKSREGTLTARRNPHLPWLTRIPNIDLDGWSILLDCANGAAAPFAKDILQTMGANVTEIASTPNGRNINLDCGALHPPMSAD